MTGVWRWILLYVLALLALQLVVYYYVQRDDDGGVASAAGNGGADEGSGWADGWTRRQATGKRPRTTEPDESDGSAANAEARPPEGGASVRCPHCGALNGRESVFRFCRSCAGELGVR